MHFQNFVKLDYVLDHSIQESCIYTHGITPQRKEDAAAKKTLLGLTARDSVLV